LFVFFDAKTIHHARAGAATGPYAEDLLIEDVGNSNTDEVL
jgi:hypothetical protein